MVCHVTTGYFRSLSGKRALHSLTVVLHLGLPPEYRPEHGLLGAIPVRR